MGQGGEDRGGEGLAGIWPLTLDAAGKDAWAMRGKAEEGFSRPGRDMPPWKTKKSVQPTEVCLGEGGLAREELIRRLDARLAPRVRGDGQQTGRNVGLQPEAGWAFLHGRRLPMGISGGQDGGEGSVCIKYFSGPEGRGVFL